MNPESGIAILAPGLLGGSLALAARKRFPMTPIRVWARRPEAVDEVRQRIPSVIGCESIAECVQGATMAVLCMPVQHMPAAAEQMAAAEVHPDLLVTDVGSVKGSVVAALEPVLAAKGIVDEPYQLARKLGCKAVSYYRDGSREGQVLNSMKKVEEKGSGGVEETNTATHHTSPTPRLLDSANSPRRAPPCASGFDLENSV